MNKYPHRSKNIVKESRVHFTTHDSQGRNHFGVESKHYVVHFSNLHNRMPAQPSSPSPGHIVLSSVHYILCWVIAFFHVHFHSVRLCTANEHSNLNCPVRSVSILDVCVCGCVRAFTNRTKKKNHTVMHRLLNVKMEQVAFCWLVYWQHNYITHVPRMLEMA